MDDADADPGREGDRDRNSTGGDRLTWADLFERATTYGTEETAVREAVTRRREGADE